MKKKITSLLSEFIALSNKHKNCYTCKHYNKTNNGYEYCKKLNEEYPFDWTKFNSDSLSKLTKPKKNSLDKPIKHYSLCKGKHYVPGVLKF